MDGFKLAQIVAVDWHISVGYIRTVWLIEDWQVALSQRPLHDMKCNSALLAFAELGKAVPQIKALCVRRL